MFADVSYDNQDYYYVDKAQAFVNRFHDLEEWRIDFAALQHYLIQVYVNYTGFGESAPFLEISDVVYECLNNTDAEKLLGFKKIIVDKVLRGDKNLYNEFCELWRDDLASQNRFDFSVMCGTLLKSQREVLDDEHIGVFFYDAVANALIEKLCKVDLKKEYLFYSEARVLCNAYDDFILGLRMNQQLYEEQQTNYRTQVALMQSQYDEKLKLILEAARQIGVLPELSERFNILEQEQLLLAGQEDDDENSEIEIEVRENE
jgi:hypothetical protein